MIGSHVPTDMLAEHETEHVPSILVVDDDPVTNRLLCRWLGVHGYAVSSTSSGEDALTELHSHPPDVLLLDIMLPGISGLDVLEHIRQHGLDIAVIMITASDTSDTAISALRNRADNYIRKPINFSECEIILERTVSRVRLHRQNEVLRRQLDEKRRQLETELARAAQVQADLLPREMPALSGFELAARCIAAREVGGDFYDWQMPNDTTLNLTLGDVTGKGMSAALLMATARAALRAVGRQNPPATVVQETARALETDLERTERFVTLFFGQLDTASRTLTYVDAGHGHVFLRRATGEVETLPQGGMPLGIFTNAEYTQGTLTLDAGDVLVVYSDGLVDARPDLNLDHAALAAYLTPAMSAQEIVDVLVGLTGTAGTLPDDLTIMALRCCPSE